MAPQPQGLQSSWGRSWWSRPASPCGHGGLRGSLSSLHLWSKQQGPATVTLTPQVGQLDPGTGPTARPWRMACWESRECQPVPVHPSSLPGAVSICWSSGVRCRTQNDTTAQLLAMLRGLPPARAHCMLYPSPPSSRSQWGRTAPATSHPTPSCSPQPTCDSPFTPAHTGVAAKQCLPEQRPELVHTCKTNLR